MAGEEGLEPPLPGPKPGVLPLDDSPSSWGVLFYSGPTELEQM
jgi:hypothetical protein